MKTLIVATIALLLAVGALDTVLGKLQHGNLAKGKQSYKSDDDAYEEYVNCAENGFGASDDEIQSFHPGAEIDSRLMECVAACHYAKAHKFIVPKKMFDKDAFAQYLAEKLSQDDAKKAADECDNDIKNGTHDFCDNGNTVNNCIKRSLPDG